MSNIAVIIAGGSGSRMRQDILRQFINMHDKTVSIYALDFSNVTQGRFDFESDADMWLK